MELAPIHTNFENATLATLEDALARATAMTMWTVARANTFSTFSFPNGLMGTFGNDARRFSVTTQQGTAPVTRVTMVGQLTVCRGFSNGLFFADSSYS